VWSSLRLRCAEAELPSVGHSAAPVTSLSARACCKAAWALWMLVLAASACAISLLSNASSNRSHQFASDWSPATGWPSAPDHAAGTAKLVGSPSCVGTDVQAHSVTANTQQAGNRCQPQTAWVAWPAPLVLKIFGM